MSKQKEFFIGWEAESPKSLRKSLHLKAVFLLVLTAAIGISVAMIQNSAGNGRFAFGEVETYMGILLNEPVPVLVLEEDVEGHRIFFLVNPFKEGIEKSEISDYHLKLVSVEGTLIHDDKGAMIEVVPDGINDLGDSDSPMPTISKGISVTLRGEIVDSKCYLGMMNPGRFKPHRACAIQCLKGGIPPLLVAETNAGELAQYVLVGPEGGSINERVIEFVAEPVELSGKLWNIGDRFVVFVDPLSVRRL